MTSEDRINRAKESLDNMLEKADCPVEFSFSAHGLQKEDLDQFVSEISAAGFILKPFKYGQSLTGMDLIDADSVEVSWPDPNL